MTWTDRLDYEASAMEDRDMWERMGYGATPPRPLLTTPPADDPWPTPEEEARARAEGALHFAEEELKRARQAWYETLPALTDGLRCSRCGKGDDWGDLRVTTEGYQQWVRCEIDFADDEDETPYLCAHTDGWDDMSDDGDFCYVTCEGCGQAHTVPDTLEWA